ncbi:hypothetical protein E1I69_13310 [Bacillus timonensis]|uniref:Uncharacterized protein n=1 Tax=Bacillus timonensis TaxID=1033734 RepID=A0A4S3PQH5_9BACI|nr:hypothetical protein [Bacillus timonensis]THE11859.1 hypothetical protein E1I69_13310 [Bacillus timonensis]
MKVKLPKLSILLMAIYLIGGIVIILVPMAPGPGNIDWDVMVISYMGYLYLVIATLIYYKMGK